MALFALVHIKRHCIITMHTGEQRDAPQSRHHGSVRHTESRSAEIIHVDNNVTVLILNGIEGQDAVFALGKDIVEDGCDALNDAKVELGLRYHLGESGEDEFDLGAGDLERDVVVEKSKGFRRRRIC